MLDVLCTMEGSYMKYRIVLALALASLSASAAATSLCQEKEQDIQREIGYAEKHNNQNRIDGLKKAFQAHCTDSKLRADHQEKIAEQKDEVREREQDLKEAKQKGDADKVAKRAHKLQEAKKELNALESRAY